jgi:hypothetical protein
MMAMISLLSRLASQQDRKRRNLLSNSKNKNHSLMKMNVVINNQTTMIMEQKINIKKEIMKLSIDPEVVEEVEDHIEEEEDIKMINTSLEEVILTNIEAEATIEGEEVVTITMMKLLVKSLLIEEEEVKEVAEGDLNIEPKQLNL